MVVAFLQAVGGWRRTEARVVEKQGRIPGVGRCRRRVDRQVRLMMMGEGEDAEEPEWMMEYENFDYNPVVEDDGSWEGAPELNSVVLVGVVAGVPDVRVTPKMKVAKFQLLVKRDYPAERGSDFFSIVCFRFDAELVEKTFQEGMVVGIEGALSLNTWEKNGEKNVSIEVIANKVKIMENKNNSFSGKPDSYATRDDGYEPRSSFSDRYDRDRESVMPPPPPQSNQSMHYSGPPRMRKMDNDGDQDSADDNKGTEGWLEFGISSKKAPSNNSGKRKSEESSASSASSVFSASGADSSASSGMKDETKDTKKTSETGIDNSIAANLPDDYFAKGSRGGMMPRKKGFSDLKNSEWNNDPVEEEPSRPSYRSDEFPEVDPF